MGALWNSLFCICKVVHHRTQTHTHTDVERTKCSQSKKVSVFRPTDALFFFSNKPDGAIGAVQLGSSKKGGGFREKLESVPLPLLRRTFPQKRTLDCVPQRGVRRQALALGCTQKRQKGINFNEQNMHFQSQRRRFIPGAATCHEYGSEFCRRKEGPLAFLM